ncbi:hypothetical protein F4777DRAFT_166800 [Nemania sp. FL0916]|nr:hypothetical protein F4777DRAFT_166800 [Nemania sp. FL0916]
MEAMSKELNELRSQSMKSGTTSTTSTDDSGFSADMAANLASAIPADDFELSVETVGIGCVAVPAAVAVEAFNIFATFFHPRLPVLVSININDIYHTCPFLFWTIISIVSSHTTIPSSPGLFDQIAGPFQDMARNEALQAPLPLQKVRALLLLCMWPMPVDCQQKDPSWLYSGIAVNSALYLGLRQSGMSVPSRGGYPETPLDRIITWLGCFFVSGSLSMHLGLPAIIDNSSELARVAACIQDYPLSREFASEIKLQTIIIDFTNVLAHTANDGAIDSSILHLLDRELEALKTSYPDQWGCMLEYNTLVAKLHMYGQVISRDRVGNMGREILLKLSFTMCLRIIYLANVRHGENPPEKHGVPAKRQKRALPKAYFKGLAFTTAFLLRYFSLNTTASAEEQQLAANHVVLSHSIFKSCSYHPRDEMNRAAEAFEELCQHGPMRIDSQRAAPGDRVGLSLLLQAMRLATAKNDFSASSLSPPAAPSPAQPVTASPNMIPPPAYAVPVNPTLDPWAMDMISVDQYWAGHDWDSLGQTFMDTHFQPR